MKRNMLVVLTLIVTFAYSQTNVTFRANTSLLHGVVDSTSGIDLRGTVTQWAPGTNLTSVGGDYWEITLQLAPGDYEYKYGAQLKNQDGTISDYWENDIPGAIGGAGNRTLTVGSDDVVLDMDYVGDDYSGHPYFTPTDNIDVYFRVNMSEDSDFTVGQDTVSIVGGFDSIVDGTGTGLNGMWSPGTFVLKQEGTSSYYYYHMELSEPTDVHGDAFGAGVGQIMYRFAKGTIGSWGASENLGGAYVDGNENRIIRVTADTTVQWFYWNDKGPAPFEASDSLASLTFTTDVSAAIAADGFDQGDTLLVKWGYGGTQQSVRTDTLTAGFGTVYSVTIPMVGVDLESDGMFYQYYRFKNDTEYREIFYNFAYDGSDASLAERRLSDLAGATDGSDYTISDAEDSNVSPRRLPKFRNANKICAGCPDDNVIEWTYVVDLRPAYYQVLAGSVLDDIQGDVDISSVEQIDELGVYMNGPATVDQIQTESWTTWGGTLAQTEHKKMWDDGMTDNDMTAGDTLYSNAYQYQSNSTELGQEFKFGIGGGDNEGGYGNNHIENLTADISNTFIYATWGSIDPNFYSAWDYDTNTPYLDVKLTGGALPHQFSLGDNYPNPFNPTTTVEFKLPIGTDVTLTIYNLLGEKVATIYNSYAQPGNYQATWNGLDSHGNQVPTGTYLFELNAGNHFHKVKKMTFMK